MRTRRRRQLAPGSGPRRPGRWDEVGFWGPWCGAARHPAGLERGPRHRARRSLCPGARSSSLRASRGGRVRRLPGQGAGEHRAPPRTGRESPGTSLNPFGLGWSCLGRGRAGGRLDHSSVG